MTLVGKTILYVNLVGLILQFLTWKSEVWWGMATLLTWSMLNLILIGVWVTAWTSRVKTKILQKES